MPFGPRPIVNFSGNTKIWLISQAPGSVVHSNGVAWMDQSGKRLRRWLGVDEDTFYNPDNFGILPMGFCYPGKGKSGDLPPRPECAPLWHDKMLRAVPDAQIKILIGQYAQRAYLGEKRERTLTETVKSYQAYTPDYFPLPHPSPRNRIWLARNAWFEAEVVPELQRRVRRALEL
ncbi:MAG: uracil-DNA glycosylase family protein [Bacteroidota bacterium]